MDTADVVETSKITLLPFLQVDGACYKSKYYLNVHFKSQLQKKRGPILVGLYLVCWVFLFASLKGRKVGQRPLTTRVQTHIVRYATASEQIMVEYSSSPKNSSQLCLALQISHNYV